MIKVYTIADNYLVPLAPEQHDEGLENAAWIDMINPTPAEIANVEKFCNLTLPNIQDTEEIEASSHYEVYPHGLSINCSFLHQESGYFSITNVAFLFNNKCLISLCSREVSTLNQLQERAQKMKDLVGDPMSTIVSLIEDKIERLADLSEEAHVAIEKISRQIFNRDGVILEETIDNLSRQDDLNGKIRLCLMDGQRDLNFLLRRGHMVEENTNTTNDTLEDIKTLLSHNTFLSERLDFLLNAALGFINIEQNKIIKIFSIVAVVFMPPTVIASIFGMNFQHMPELEWAWGYPLSLLSMVIAGLAPYIYFKRKGWL
ncbi:MAG: magnesium/cobalt transporter CorA [Desulforhopalus sp.]|nr:magnesium/cobalt transporter CorA [Desulforhopalus sp.]